MPDCVAERGGFEPAVPRGLLWAEIRPEFGALFGPTKATVPDRICSPLDSALLRLSPVRFVRQGGTPMLGDVEDQAKASGSNPRGDGAQADDGDMLACVFS